MEREEVCYFSVAEYTRKPFSKVITMSVPHTCLESTLVVPLGSGSPECRKNVLCTWEREIAHLVGNLIAYMHNLQEGSDIVALRGCSTIMGSRVGWVLSDPLRTDFLGGENRPPSSDTEMLIALVQGSVR